jgi:hypothetical protein
MHRGHAAYSGSEGPDPRNCGDGSCLRVPPSARSSSWHAAPRWGPREALRAGRRLCHGRSHCNRGSPRLRSRPGNPWSCNPLQRQPEPFIWAALAFASSSTRAGQRSERHGASHAPATALRTNLCQVGPARPVGQPEGPTVQRAAAVGRSGPDAEPTRDTGAFRTSQGPVAIRTPVEGLVLPSGAIYTGMG